MKQKQNLVIYSCIWAIAVFILVFSLFQNMGDAKIINYSGIIRGATQKLVKKELSGDHDDALITYIDGVLVDLQTGQGDYGLVKLEDSSYQDQLLEIDAVWKQMKQEITNVRSGALPDNLYQLSEEYFEMTDHMVTTAQLVADKRLTNVILVFVIYLVVTISSFLIWHRYKQKQISKAMYIDELTGINNVLAFEHELVNIVSKLEEDMLLICMDIDGFKYLNSVYGSRIGDKILKSIASTLQKFVEKKGYCARYGNDEFFLLCKDQPNIIMHLDEEIKKAVQESIKLDLASDLSLTWGVYAIQKEDTITNMMDNVSLAHKQAKTMGKGSCLYYNDELLSTLYREGKLAKQMYEALKEKEFKLYLQPKFKIPSLEIVGAEALVRWQKKDGTILYPDEFIPFFERNAFIYELDFYMLEEACIFIKENHLEKTSFRISVNFSRITIHHQGFNDSIKKILNKYDIPIQCIEIEITENAINDFSKHIIEMLDNLGKEGFILSMDDFGAGYSSLTSIHAIPAHIIKIDRRFLQETHQDNNVEVIMRFIVEIARLLGKEVICEGVEVKKDIELLERIQCPFGQGYYISKPVYKTDFVQRFLTTKNRAL